MQHQQHFRKTSRQILYMYVHDRHRWEVQRIQFKVQKVQEIIKFEKVQNSSSFTVTQNSHRSSLNISIIVDDFNDFFSIVFMRYDKKLCYAKWTARPWCFVGLLDKMRKTDNVYFAEYRCRIIPFYTLAKFRFPHFRKLVEDDCLVWSLHITFPVLISTVFWLFQDDYLPKTTWVASWRCR